MAPLRRLEIILLALFLAGWIVIFLHWLHLVRLAGNLPLGSLYPLYSFASALGWASGTAYVHRRQGTDARGRNQLLLIYYLGPPALVCLLWAMTPIAFQKAAPLVPIYAFGVFSIFFLVPVKLLRLAR